MGKSSKKSNVEVAAAAVSVPPAKQAKKGKRDAGEVVEKQVSAKKQKKEAVEVVLKPKDVKKSKKASHQPPPKKKPESSSEDLTSSESDEEIGTKVTLPTKKLPVTGAKKAAAVVSKKESSDSSDSDSSDDDNGTVSKSGGLGDKLLATSRNGAVAASKTKESSSESSESESDDDETAVPSNVSKANVKVVKKESSSDEDEDDNSEESSDDEPSKAPQDKKPTKAAVNSSSSEEDSSEEESEDEQPTKTPKKRDTDVKMKDAPSANSSESEKKGLKTPSTNQNQTSGSKTLFVGNLSFEAGQDDVAEFFQEVGEVVGVRLATSEDGRFRGFGHIEFATEEAAHKALEMNGQDLLGRAVKLDIARERGSYTPANGKENSSFQKGGKGQSQTVFIKGFDKSLDEEQIRSSLEEHFGSCGDITRVSIPKDYETGGPKGIAYMDFKDQDSFSKALELSGSELGDYTLTVDEAKPKNDSRDGGWSGGRGRGGDSWSGGRGRGRDSGGRRGGRDSGGRFGGRRGGGRGGGGRGRGPSNRPSMATAGTGRKTTFGDD